MRRAICKLDFCRPCFLAELSAASRLPRPSIEIRVPGHSRLLVPGHSRFLSDFSQRNGRNLKSQSKRNDSVQSEFVESSEKNSADIFGNFGKIQKNRENSSRNSTGNFFPANDSKAFQNVAKPLEEIAVAREDLEEDLFGTISDPDFQKLKDYEEEDVEDLPQFIPYKQRPWWYLLHMKKLIRKKRLPDALEFFEVRMRVEDRVRPLRTVYDMLIAACGRAGYVKKAFKLYVDMKGRGYSPVDATFVGLFNACAECPTAFQEDALNKARKLREELYLKGHVPNQIVYHSMVKAFGRLGDLVTAFQLADEMAVNRICIDDATFAFLLMACISDKESGLTHAIKVWRMMLQTGATPGLNHYNLLLKAVRDCKLGDPNFASMELLPSPSKPAFSPNGSVMSQLAPRSELQSHLEPTGFRPEMLPSVRDVDESQSVTSQVYAYMANPKGQWSLTFERETRNRKNSGNSNAAGRNGLERYGLEEKELAERNEPNEYQSISAILSEEQKTLKSSKEDRKKTWFKELQARNSDSRSVAPSVDLVVPASDGSHMMHDLLAPLKSGQTSNIFSIREALTPKKRLDLFGGYFGILSRMNRDEVCPDEKFLTQLIDAIPHTKVAEEDLLWIAKKLKIKLGTDFYNILIKKRISRRDSEGAMEIYRLIQSKRLLVNEMTFGCLARGCQTIAAAEEMLAEMQKHDLVPNIKIFGSLCANALFRKDVFYIFFVISKMKQFNVSPDEKILSGLETFRTDTRKAVLAMEKGKSVDPVYSSPSFLKSWNKFCLFYKSWLQKTPVPPQEHPWAIYGHGKSWPSLERRKKEQEDEIARQAIV